VGISETKNSFYKPGSIWENSIKYMLNRKIRVNLARDRHKCRAVVNGAINILVLLKTDSFLTCSVLFLSADSATWSWFAFKSLWLLIGTKKCSHYVFKMRARRNTFNYASVSY
jgi:hypothetical protein